MITSLRRVTRTAFANFWRNGWVSVATISVMVVALFVAGSLLLFQVLLNSTLKEVQDKVDVIVYFKTDADDAGISEVRKIVSNLPQVSEAQYVSREEALALFKERHKGNALITSALDEFGNNPLGASLRIHARDPGEYESIAGFVEDGNFPAVDKVNFHQNELVFNRLASVISTSRNIGFGVSVALAVIAFLVTLNTIRLAIYTSRDEIGIMRLVGASRWFVRGPFIIEGMIHGVVSAIIATLIFWPTLLWIGPKANKFFGGVELFAYYSANILQFFALLLAIGVVVGVFSSFAATRKHLKV